MLITMMYTIIYLHVINLYLFKLLYTVACINLVYTVIYACIQCIEDKAQTWYIRVYTKYMIGLFFNL